MEQMHIQTFPSSTAALPWLTTTKVAAFCGGVGLVFLVLSVWHLTAGISRVTADSSPWKIHSFLMACCIDSAIVASELALIVATGHAVLPQIRAYSVGMLVLMLATSAGLNILHLTDGLDPGGLFFWFATGWGVIIPISVYCMFQQAAKLWLAHRFDPASKPSDNGNAERQEPDLATADYVKARTG